MHGTVPVPRRAGRVLAALAGFCRPGDPDQRRLHGPGQLGHRPAGGAQFKYGLLWVVGLASLMAIFMQVISARLGVATGKDLAQCCRDWYPRWTRWPNWLCCEIAIGACDLAEVLGSAVALNLLFHIPLLWAVIITGLDVLLLLALQRFGMRTIEAVVAAAGGHHRRSAISSRSLFCPRPSPASWRWAGPVVTPSLCAGRDAVRRHRHHRRHRDAAQSVPALGPGAEPQAAEATKPPSAAPSASTPSTPPSALTIAFFVNAAILVLAAMVFFGKESVTVAGRPGRPRSAPTATGSASPT